MRASIDNDIQLLTEAEVKKEVGVLSDKEILQVSGSGAGLNFIADVAAIGLGVGGMLVATTMTGGLLAVGAMAVVGIRALSRFADES